MLGKGFFHSLWRLFFWQHEELSAQQIRVGLVEKKLENAGKDGEDRVAKVQRKLDEANITLKKKEK